MDEKTTVSRIEEAREIASQLGLHFKGHWKIEEYDDFLFTDPLNGTTFHVPVDSRDLFISTLNKLQRKRDEFNFARLRAKADQGDLSALVESSTYAQMLMKI